MPYAELADVRLHYEFEGDSAAPVLMLSNSLGTDLGMWAPQMPALTTSFRVLRYDTRGHGQSSVPPGPYTVAQLGRDTLDLLDALEIPRAHFCGLSMGGMTGMWLGIHVPERMISLALCNTAAKIGTAETWDARIAAVRAGGMKSIVDAVLARWFTPAFIAKATPELAAVRAELERTPPDGYTACCAAVRDMDQRDAIAGIRTPTLVIAGTHDLATPPAEGRLVADRIPDARYVELPAAHLSNIEATPGFNAALTSFLARAAV